MNFWNGRSDSDAILSFRASCLHERLEAEFEERDTVSKIYACKNVFVLSQFYC